MEDKMRCQSCGMPLSEEHKDFLGTNADGSKNWDYCMYCYKNGAFTQPDMTLEKMIQSSVDYMTTKLNYKEEDARKMSGGILPKLKRWAK